MKLELRQTVYLRCSLCGRSTEDHAPDCPEGMTKAVLARVRCLPCPVCHHYRVDINTGDYYECRDCHTQFSASSVVAGEDPDTLETAFLIDERQNEAIRVLVMKTKGTGQIVLDLRLAEIDKLRKTYKRRRKG